MDKKNVKKVAIKKSASKNGANAIAIKPETGVFRIDAGQTAILKKIGRTSASNAIRASKALELPMTFMEKGVLFRELPDGTKQVLSVEPSSDKKSKIILRKGMILHAKK